MEVPPPTPTPPPKKPRKKAAMSAGVARWEMRTLGEEFCKYTPCETKWST